MNENDMGRLLYEVMKKYTEGERFQLVPHLPAPEGNPYPASSTFACAWESLFPQEKNFFIEVAREVIDGGHAVSNAPS